MKYTWIVLALAGLDQGIKQNIEDQEDQTLPRDLPCAKGWIRLHKNHNAGFPFGVMKNRPQLVQTIPLMMTSALAGALAALSGRREGLAEKLGLAMVASLVMLAPAVLIFRFGQKYLELGIQASGLKE